MNSKLALLQPYPFEKLNQLKAGITPADKAHIALSIGEPKHRSPDFVKEALNASMDLLGSYPKTKGIDELRIAIARWLENRFDLYHVNEDTQVLPVNGTREALFAFTQAVINSDQDSKPLVLMPNPFYQIYEGAALLAGAEPVFLNCVSDNNYIPDYDAISAETWQQCQLLFICSPGNPTGAVTTAETLKKLIKLADQYDFIIAADECYSELYFDQAPIGLLEVCREIGRQDYDRCVVFHSLSKRSNLPGMRSGFVAGDAKVLADFLLYRTYHGCAMPEQVQIASISAWQDEDHVEHNREIYREKFAAVLDILSAKMDVTLPDASFYLWPKLKGCDIEFTRDLYQAQNITLLPGQFLSRQANGINPGQHHVRMALVAPLGECIEAANRIKQFLG